MATIKANLPASRTDALSVVLITLASALIGTLPGEESGVCVLVTTLANLWTIVSSALTFQALLQTPEELTSHLGLFLCGLLALSSITSTLLLVSIAFAKVDTVFRCAFVGSVVTVIVAFFLCIVQLVCAYFSDCDTPRLKSTAFCKHSSHYVIEAAVGAAIGGPVCAFLLAWSVARCAKRSFQTALDLKSQRGGLSYQRVPSERDRNKAKRKHHESSMLLNRMSALCKVFVLGVYWFLVDADLTWDYTINGHNAGLWTTGQWTKQGVAILTSLFSCRIS